MFGHKIIEMMDRLIEMEPLVNAMSKSQQLRMQSLMMAAGSNLSNHFDQVEYARAGRSVKYHLEDGQRFYADALPESVKIADFDKEELKLPFPLMNLLFEDPHDRVKTCFSCKEVSPSDGWLPAGMMGAAEFTPYFVMQVVYQEADTKLFEIGNMMYLFGERHGEAEVMTVEQKFADGYLNKSGVSAVNQAKALSLAEEYLGIFLGFLQMLHCNNVTTQSEPAPKKLNKKRKQKNRPPLFEYKVLRVKRSDGTTTSMYGESGSGSSPRLHHRRGYFGRRWMGHGDNKKLVRTWVSPCMVGREDKGTIEKDYVL